MQSLKKIHAWAQMQVPLLQGVQNDDIRLCREYFCGKT